MKPIYQGCMEKSIQHVATVAAEQALGGSGNGKSWSSTQMNGKVKKSWEYAIEPCPTIKAQKSQIKSVVPSNNKKFQNNNNKNNKQSSFSSSTSSWWNKLNFFKSKSEILPTEHLKSPAVANVQQFKNQQKRKRDKG